MSLLGRGAPHIAAVQNRKRERDQRGTPILVNDGAPINVRCKVEPVRDWSSAEEQQYLGLQVTDMRVVYSRTWPGDVDSLVTVGGQLYETIGAPQLYNASKRTTHYRITLKWIRKVV